MKNLVPRAKVAPAKRSRKGYGDENGEGADRPPLLFSLVLDVIFWLKCSLSWIRSGNFFLPYGLVDNE